ncbi:rhodanese-like domain-containing protein [Conexibacter sp. CPCC 206217]|uniref:MBL fold metallo-hydrolase n=1 Tax=Conexibacter sp. CPCC 206217 TaxID=3064574 RepID=UPI00271D2B24|nr:MBL fold metallo-hydrolase [Conexibacter sp. CPCC 206217]MDO8212323.1 MBL fold metallo-hydrolase [Conexibacter sp. CPCC 206217]
MIFRQLLDRDLGCACYLLGDGGSGVVVDPGLDVERIVAAAEQEGLEIELIAETHVHADHVSGRAELAQRTGARVLLPAGGDYDDGAGEPLRDGQTLDVGNLRLTALAAPGHRPEHTVLVVADRSRSDAPWLLLSGDSLLVGDLARPDLAVDPGEGAAALHATLARLGELPDGVELWPGHVGGSLCGGPGLSRKPSSTLGYERAVNPLLAADPEELTARLIASLPDRPPTVEAVVASNRRAVPSAPAEESRVAPASFAGDRRVAAAFAPLARLSPAALADAYADGVTLIDARDSAAFDAAHVPGSLSLALRGNGLGTRAAWVLDPADELAVLADDEASALELARRLRAVGLARVRGIAGGDVEQFGLPLETVAPIAVAELPDLVDELTVVDVRDVPEWRDGHLRDALHLPLPRMRAEAATLPSGPLAVLCAKGPRAAFTASWLRAQGHDARRVADGGIPDLPGVGLALTTA